MLMLGLYNFMINEQIEMEHQEAGRADPLALMGELCECIDRFNEYWPSLVVRAMAFRIPFYEDGLVPEIVDLERVEGPGAIELCTQAFRAFSRPRQQHPGSVYRLPGYIVLDRLLIDEIDEINLLKRNLQAEIKLQCPKARARNVFCGQTFPGRAMLQVYRQLYTARSAIEAVRFSWSPGTHAVMHLTKAEALDLLVNRYEASIDTGDHQKALQMAIEKVRALGQTVDIIRERPRAPYPIASLIHTAGRKGVKKIVPLSVPVFIGPGIAGDQVDIGTLAPHDTNVRRQQRSDRIESTPLFTPLCLRYR